MSETDSFIDEVTEEVRRDRLFRMYRKYGWIGAVLVVAVVGGAAYSEWDKAQRAGASQAFGDAVMAAVDSETPSEALAAIEAEGARAGLRDLLVGAEQLQAGDTEAAAASFRKVADMAGLPRAVRDLAKLKWVIAADDTIDAATRDAALAELAAPGAPYEALAQEQQVLALVAAGEREAAIDQARQILSGAALTQGLQQRLSELIVALGGEPGLAG